MALGELSVWLLHSSQYGGVGRTDLCLQNGGAQLPISAFLLFRPLMAFVFSQVPNGAALQGSSAGMFERIAKLWRDLAYWYRNGHVRDKKREEERHPQRAAQEWGR